MAHIPMDGSTPIHIWEALSGFSVLWKKKEEEEEEEKDEEVQWGMNLGDGNVEEDPGRRWKGGNWG